MKQSVSISVESVTVNVGKFPVTVKGVSVSAECEYNAEEIATEATAATQVIDAICEKLGWLKPLLEKEIQISIHNRELLSKDLEKQIQTGTTRAYGPNGWSVRNSDLHNHPDTNNKKKH